MKVHRVTDRPEGRSISWSQISAAMTCGLRLKFKRQHVKEKGVSIHLLYGRALHAGIEARSKGRARSDEEATKIALGSFRYEVERQREPISWDEPWETLKDGSVSADTYSKLCTPEACEWWLRHQVPLYLEKAPDLNVVRSEHHIFVPLTPPRGAHWTTPWSFECYLDREMTAGHIVDLKSTGDAWDEGDFRKNSVQGVLYTGAYYYFYKDEILAGKRSPARFEFHVLPRTRKGDAKKGFGPAPLLQTFRIDWQPQLVQRYFDTIVKPMINVIEAGDAYVANPGTRLCSSRWCGFWDWCSFGDGEHL